MAQVAARLLEEVPTPQVAYTYGQIWTRGSTFLHDGLDLLAPVGTTVLALEAGSVRRLPRDTFGHAGAIVVRARAEPGEGWLYEHVAELPCALADGAEVQVGDPIGVVAEPLPGGYSHLHLERVSTVGADCDGLTDPCPALRDPLDDDALRAMIADRVPPVFQPLDGGDPEVSDPAAWVRLHDELGDVVAPSRAVGKALMVVCRASDRCSPDGMEVAPCSVSLSIDGPGGARFEFEGPRFDGPIFQKCHSGAVARIVYSTDAPASRSSFDRRELFLVPTSRLVGQGDRVVAEREPWLPTVAGRYELTFRARDRSGNEGSKTVTLALA